MLTNYFEFVYIINLADRADRRAEMQTQLAKLGLSLQSDKVILFPACRPADPGAFPSIGARGCFLSHLGVIEDAMARQAGSILILEDDCDFSDATAVHRAMQGLRALQDGWQVFYGGFAAQTPPGQFVIPGALTRAEPACSLGQTHCIGFHGTVLATLKAYLKSMYARPAGDPLGGPMHVDGAYCWFRREHGKLETICCTPNIAFQRPSYSDITATQKIDNSLAGRMVADIYRFVRRKLKLHIK